MLDESIPFHQVPDCVSYTPITLWTLSSVAALMEKLPLS